MTEAGSKTIVGPCVTENLSPSLQIGRDQCSTDDGDKLTPQIFRPDKMHLLAILRNDPYHKCIVLHTKFENSMDKDSIVILQKSAFSTDPKALQSVGILAHPDAIIPLPASGLSETADGPQTDVSLLQDWNATPITCNDVYYRLLVKAGLEPVNAVDMTVIHPAEAHHLKRFTTGDRHIIHEDPETYEKIIVPFLAQSPRDLTWVDNLLSGKSEVDRVLFADPDARTGFVFAEDYRWNGQSIDELHYLAIARDRQLTCLRDLRAFHIPMLQRIALEGRQRICDKYPGAISPDRIFAYFHYPPTFYWLHVHFVHVEKMEDATMRAGRAHLLEEVIRNLQLDGDYYANRTMTICLCEGSPMLDALHQANGRLVSPATPVPDTDSIPPVATCV